jgi:hypothetical protein
MRGLPPAQPASDERVEQVGVDAGMLALTRIWKEQRQRREV